MHGIMVILYNIQRKSHAKFDKTKEMDKGNLEFDIFPLFTVNL